MSEGAAGTVAKTISAYDMTFSDEIYGELPTLCQSRTPRKMLDHEYQLLIERLSGKSGENRTFFAFADTVEARSYKAKNESHGWMGIRFQSSPLGHPTKSFSTFASSMRLTSISKRRSAL